MHSEYRDASPDPGRLSRVRTCAHDTDDDDDDDDDTFASATNTRLCLVAVYHVRVYARNRTRNTIADSCGNNSVHTP